MSTNPVTASSWWVEVQVGESETTSTATAILHTRDRSHLRGHGTARLNPHDRDVPEIGYELAAARALSALAHELLLAAADDIMGVTHEVVTADDLEGDPGRARSGTHAS